MTPAEYSEYVLVVRRWLAKQQGGPVSMWEALQFARYILSTRARHVMLLMRIDEQDAELLA